MPVKRRRLTYEQGLAATQFRDDRPICMLGCDGNSTYRAAPDYGTGFGGGYQVAFPLVRDNILSRCALGFRHVMLHQPKGWAAFHHAIVAVDQGLKIFSVKWNSVPFFYGGRSVLLAEGGLNAGTYTVAPAGASYNSGLDRTEIPVVETIPVSTVAGYFTFEQTTFSASQYGVGGTLQPASPPGGVLTAGGETILPGQTYLNFLFRDVIAAVRAVYPTCDFSIYTGLWCKEPTVMESDRHFDISLDGGWFVNQHIGGYRSIGVNHSYYIDASTHAEPTNSQAQALRGISPLRMGFESFPFETVGGTSVWRPEWLLHGPHIGAFDFCMTMYPGLMDTAIAPTALPWYTCHFDLQQNSAHSVTALQRATPPYWFEINSGYDESSIYGSGTINLYIDGSGTGNEGNYTATGASYNAGTTTTHITVTPQPPFATVAGKISKDGKLSNRDFARALSLRDRGFKFASYTKFDQYLIDITGMTP